MPVLLPITTFRSAPLSSAAMAAGCFRVMRRMETPGLDDASMPVAKPPSAAFRVATSRLAAFSSTIQAVRPRTNTAEGRVLAPLKFRMAPLDVTVLSVTWVPASAGAGVAGSAGGGGTTLTRQSWLRLWRLQRVARRCFGVRLGQQRLRRRGGGFAVWLGIRGFGVRFCVGFGRRRRFRIGFHIRCFYVGFCGGGLGIGWRGCGLKLFGGVGDGGSLGIGDAGLMPAGGASW